MSAVDEVMHRLHVDHWPPYAVHVVHVTRETITIEADDDTEDTAIISWDEFRNRSTTSSTEEDDLYRAEAYKRAIPQAEDLLNSFIANKVIE